MAKAFSDGVPGNGIDLKAMSAEPLVSIIMPAYNAEKYLAAAIQSALEQSYRRWELIVVDDGSTDHTAAIARDFAAADERIEYVFQSNKKLAGARNTGIREARGELIAFLDSDDLWTREKLDLQVKKIKETKADVVFSSGFLFPEDDASNESKTFATLCGKFSGAEMFPLLFTENRLPILSAVARRKALDSGGKLFNESEEFYYGCEDYDLWLRLAKGGAVFYGMPEKLVRYRVHGNAMSSKKVELLEATLALLRRYRSDESLDESEVRKRFRGVYRALIAASIEEGNIRQAKEYARLCAKWEPHELLVFFHLALIKFLPRDYERISEHFYKAGGALKRSSATLRQKLYGQS
jgi:teichuronic acid biosynthesis glycosyltransferase TuaG